MELNEKELGTFKFEEPIIYDSSKLYLKSDHVSLDKIIPSKRLPETLKDFETFEFKELNESHPH